MNSSPTSDTSLSVGLPDLAFAGKAGVGKSTAITFVAIEYDFLNAPLECCCERRWWQLKARGFVMVRITAPDSLRYRRRWQPDAEGGFDGDSTEHLIADYTIHNDGSKIDLYEELVKIIDRERRKR